MSAGAYAEQVQEVGRTLAQQDTSHEKNAAVVVATGAVSAAAAVETTIAATTLDKARQSPSCRWLEAPTPLRPRHTRPDPTRLDMARHPPFSLFRRLILPLLLLLLSCLSIHHHFPGGQHWSCFSPSSFSQACFQSAVSTQLARRIGCCSPLPTAIYNTNNKSKNLRIRKTGEFDAIYGLPFGQASTDW